jgi:hypothetical protein
MTRGAFKTVTPVGVRDEKRAAKGSFAGVRAGVRREDEDGRGT